MNDSPRVKLLLTYDIRPGRVERYYQFMLGEFVPGAQALGLQMSGAWHTAYGNYPARLVEFVAADADQVNETLATPEWERLENELSGYVTQYTRKIVRLRDNVFQF